MGIFGIEFVNQHKMPEKKSGSANQPVVRTNGKGTTA